MEIIKPKIVFEENADKAYAKFVIEPLERGYGTTLGNALRRILLSSLPGSAAQGIKIEGVKHEFSTIPGVREDVSEIILNIKSLALKWEDNDVYAKKTITLSKSSEGPVYASDITEDPEVAILNPDLYICTLGDNAKIDMTLTIGNGRGYVSAVNNKDKNAPIGYIAIDSIYTPVEKVNYAVENTRVEQSIDYDKLTIEVWTNGTTSAKEVISLSAKIMNDHLNLFVDLIDTMKDNDVLVSRDSDKKHKLLEMSIEDLDLSVRSYNCLKRAGIHTVEDLTKRSEDDMLKVRNLGRKSLEEVIKKLHDMGLGLLSKDE
ncbi:MAG: DNA-directed RNA polymerase subunit alpha [Clostridiales bacterium]|jgi:DNA-directed RNA polymerase subunit alpha|nr:DNA-directed RNA polymerase subunit alpha [Clostridiales bacterium]